MKAPKPLLVLAVAALLGLPAFVHSQTVTTAVPGFISYQGRVVDGSGNPVGTGTPVNRTVTFRVWDHPSNTLVANLIYSEQQTVTVSEGEFSVLVGQGVAVTSITQFGYNEAPKKLADLGGAFTGSARYLGVTVDDGTATADNEITPRQQIVSTGFAFRSKFAETLGTSAGGTSLSVLDNGNIGVGNTNPPARFTISGPGTGTGSPQLIITDSGDTNERLRIGVDSTGNGTGYIQPYKEGVGAQHLLLNPLGGNVGIGTTVPNRSLTVFRPDGIVVGDEITPGATSLSLSLSAATNGVARIQAIKSQNTSFGDIVLNNSGGFVGIGKTPTTALDVNGTVTASAVTASQLTALNTSGYLTSLFDSPNTAGTWIDLRNTSVGGTNWQLISTGSGNGGGAGKLLIATGTSPTFTSATPMTIQANGNIGLGTLTPGFPLNFPATTGDKISLYGESGGHYGFGVQGSLLQIHTDAAASSVAFGSGSSSSFTESMRIAGNGTLSTMRATTGVGSEDALLISKRVGASVSSVLQLRTGGSGQAYNMELWEGNALKPGGGSWGAVSDRRLKKDIAPLKGALDKLEKLNPVTYQFIDPAKSGQLRGTQIGFIAQEVEKVFPEWVSVNAEGYKMINIRGFESLTVQALHDLRTEKDGEIKALKSDVAEGEKKIAALEKRLAELEGADKARNTRLAAIEKMLAAEAKPAAGRTVALKKASAAQ